MTKRVTIYEVAERAGVSISTVSQALNRPDRVRADTRARVLAAAEELGFVPAPEMAIRARKSVGRVGVIAPLTAYSSYQRRLAGVLELFTPLNTEVCVYDHESAAVASPLLSSVPLNRRLDGLIVMGLSMETSVVERVLKQGLPTVVVDFPTRDFTSVMTDDEEGGRMAGTHLLDRGHRRFAYLMERGGVAGFVLGGHRRVDGFRKALSEAGVPDDDVRVTTAEHGIEPARAAARELLAGQDRPTAVVCHDDVLAAGVALAARDLGLAVPDEVAVMGYDDGDVAAAANLTTVRQPFEESGRVAAQALLQRMQDHDRPVQTVLLGLELVVRATT